MRDVKKSIKTTSCTIETGNKNNILNQVAMKNPKNPFSTYHKSKKLSKYSNPASLASVLCNKKLKNGEYN